MHICFLYPISLFPTPNQWICSLQRFFFFIWSIYKFVYMSKTETGYKVGVFFKSIKYKVPACLELVGGGGREGAKLCDLPKPWENFGIIKYFKLGYWKDKTKVSELAKHTSAVIKRIPLIIWAACTKPYTVSLFLITHTAVMGFG